MMCIENDQFNKEYMIFEENEIYKYLFSALLDEIKGAEEYIDYYESAKTIGNQSLASMFLKHANDELNHFDNLIKQIDVAVGNIENNPLSPLYLNIKDWRNEIAESLSILR